MKPPSLADCSSEDEFRARTAQHKHWAIQIHELKDRLGNTDLAGATPALLTRAGAPVYKYADHARLAARIEEAAKRAGR